MPKYVASGSEYVYHVDFIVNGELVAPSSATITITNNAHSVVGDFDDKEIDLEAEQVSADIVIGSADNTGLLVSEIRYIRVNFVFNGVTYTLNDFYMLRDTVVFPLSSSDVLAVLGMSPSDLPVDNIDILNAYRLVQEDLGDEVNADLILTNGTALLPALIDAVKYKAASIVSIGSQNSLMQMEQADNTLYRRFMEIDFGKIDGDIARQYSYALWKLQGSPSTEAPLFSTMVAGTDAVTGEDA